jgi:cell wall-associated NlpC family hydrolase
MIMTLKRPLVWFVLMAALFTFCFATPLSALAVPQSKLNEARAAKTKLEELTGVFGKTVDEYNAAQEAHDAAVAKHEKAKDKLAKTSGRLDEVQGYLNKRAVDMYRQGPYAFLEVLLGATTFEEFTATWDILSDINQQNAVDIDELSTLKAEQIKLKSILSEQERIAAEQASEMETKKAQIENQIAEQKRLVAGLENEIEALRAEEAAAAQAAAESANSGGYYEPPQDWGPPSGYTPPTGGGNAAVLDVARQFLGVPYVWGGSSPSGFDCSGLVMYCYAQLGIYLPRTSYAMMSYGQYVAYGDLQPGDIVVTSGGGHVGLYAGGGQMIHAPMTGDVVRYGPVFDFVMGRRP